MKSLIKFVLISTGLLLIIMGVVIAVGHGQMERMIHESTRQALSQELGGVHVDIQSVTMPWRGPSIELQGVVISNPPVFQDGFVLRVDKAELRFRLAELLADVPVIDEMRLSGVAVDVKHRLTSGTNANQIIQHADLDGTSGRIQGRNISIKRLVLSEAATFSVSSTLLPARPAPIEVEPFTMESPDGFKGDAGWFAAKVIHETIDRAMTVENITQGIRDLFREPKS